MKPTPFAAKNAAPTTDTGMAPTMKSGMPTKKNAPPAATAKQKKSAKALPVTKAGKKSPCPLCLKQGLKTCTH